MILDKAKLAHDYAVKYFEVALKDNADSDFNFKHVSLIAWEYADAMQAEADKRKPKGVPKALQQTFVNDVEQPRYAPQVFKIDWSLAPSDSKYWAVDENGEANWYQKKPYIDYDEFNYEFDIF